MRGEVVVLTKGAVNDQIIHDYNNIASIMVGLIIENTIQYSEFFFLRP